VGLGDWLIALIGRRRWESKSTEAEAEAAAADTSADDTPRRDANPAPRDRPSFPSRCDCDCYYMEGKWNTGDA
jgi:hypothetical protein